MKNYNQIPNENIIIFVNPNPDKRQRFFNFFKNEWCNIKEFKSLSPIEIKSLIKKKFDNIKISDSFEVESGIPLDVRFVVKSLEELHSLKPTVCYAGMGVIVSDQASLYILREPVDGIIDEAYIKDEESVNWKKV